MTTATNSTADDISSTDPKPIRITVEIEHPSTLITDLGPHARGAARDALLTLRGAIDVALRFVDTKDETSTPRGPTRIKIE